MYSEPVNVKAWILQIQDCLHSGIIVYKNYQCTWLSLLLNVSSKEKETVWQIECSNMWLKGWKTRNDKNAVKHCDFQKPYDPSLLQPGCLLVAIHLQMSKVSRLVIKAMVYWCSGVDIYELYHVTTSLSKQILILLLPLIHEVNQFSEY